MQNRNTVRMLFELALLIVLAAGCSGRNQGGSDGPDAIELRVMTFNIEWGGTNISFDNVAEAVRRSGADLVGIQEAEGNLKRLADDLGWNYSLRNYAISKYPLVEPHNADGFYVLVETSPGRVVALANVHLPSDPAGPHEIRDGAELSQIIELERKTRLPMMQNYLPKLATLVDQGIPVFLTGDFNAPSHQDWTEAAVGSRPFLPYAVDWPVSRAVSEAGFKDSWRVVHNDPVTHPGLTWWAKRPPVPSYTPGDDDPQDRIDFVWYAGPVKVHASEIVGEAGRADAAIQIEPWPSDHRAVVSTFSVFPATMPELVSTGRRVYGVGEDVEVIFHGAPHRLTATTSRLAADGSARAIHEHVVESGVRSRIASSIFAPGHYRISIAVQSGATLRSDFWVMDRNRKAAIEVMGSDFVVGQPIPVTWSNGPGNRNDYVAVYAPNSDARYEADEYEQGLPWAYIGAKPEGSAHLEAGNAGWGWPIEPGTYVMRLMEDDGYDILAESGIFRVHQAERSAAD